MNNQKKKKGDLVANIFFYSTMFIAFSVLILIVLGNETKPKGEYELDKMWEREIEPIGNKEILNITSENNKTHYTFLVKDKNDEFSTISLDTEYVKVVYVESDGPLKLEKYKRKYGMSDSIRMMFAPKDSTYEYKIYVNKEEKSKEQKY